VDDAAPTPRRAREMRDVDLVRRTLIVLGIVALAYAAYLLSGVLLLAFASVLIAVLLHALADVLARRTLVPERWSLLVAGVTLLLILATIGVLFGTAIRGQISGVADRLPAALDEFTRGLGIGEVSGRLPEMLGGDGGNFAGRIASLGSTLLGAIADALLVVIASVFIAISPKVYRVGLVKLFPVSDHPRVEGALDASGAALKLWIVAQLISMTFVAVAAALALWLIGVPSAIGLALIVGLADFMPFIGPVIGALPAVLLALTVSPETALYTALAFVVIQQLENNVVFPLAGNEVLSVPPALGLFAIVAAGVLFGPLGLLLGFPLAVIAFVLVKKLYVRETLGEETPVPGEENAEGAEPA
jgi:predicted PurR-regulated permease PerM